MSNRPAPFFTVLFVVITALEMIGETLPIRWLHYGTKPLLMLSLLAYAWPVFRVGRLRGLAVGMVFALLGDVFLMIREVDLFAPGLAAFLVMQVCYGLTFWRAIGRAGLPAPEVRTWLWAIPFVVYLALFLVVLRPTFAQNAALSVLWWPVVVYAVCLNTMGLLAVQRRGLPAYGRVVAGALLFILSDSAIAVNRFLLPLAGATWLVMSTYAAAQYLIVSGLTDPALPVQPRHTR